VAGEAPRPSATWEREKGEEEEASVVPNPCFAAARSSPGLPSPDLGPRGPAAPPPSPDLGASCRVAAGAGGVRRAGSRRGASCLTREGREGVGGAD